MQNMQKHGYMDYAFIWIYAKAVFLLLGYWAK